MATIYNHPATPSVPAAILRTLGRFDRPVLESFITVAIELLDVMDGDTDLEPNGDELDGNNAEDDFWPHSNWLDHAGCPVSDPPEDDDAGI